MKQLFIFLALFTAINLSAQWVSFTPAFPDTIGIVDVEVVSPSIIWAVGVRLGVSDSLYTFGAGNETYYTVTQDGGATWKTGTVPMGPTPFIANLAATDAGTAYVIGLSNFAEAKTLKTVDGGTTWQVQSSNWDQAISWPDYIHAFSPAKACVIGDPRNGEFEIYNTFNAGQVWQPVAGSNIPDPLPGEFGYNNVGAAVGNTIWFGTSSGRVYRSKNSGGLWEASQTPLPAIGYISFADSNNGIVTGGIVPGSIVRMYNTADGGDTWTEISIVPHGGHFSLFGATCIPGEQHLLIGITTESLLSGPNETWISPDRGNSWQQVSSGEIIGWPTFLDKTNGWAGEYQQLSHPTKLFKYSGNPLSGLLTSATLDGTVAIFPNPTADFAEVTVQQTVPSACWCLLNDINGHLLRKFNIAPTAKFSQKVDLTGLPAGTYFITITNEKGSITKQVIKE